MFKYAIVTGFNLLGHERVMVFDYLTCIEDVMCNLCNYLFRYDYSINMCLFIVCWLVILFEAYCILM